MTLSDLYFGDLEAIDEGNNHYRYFHATFILPSSFSLASLRNNRNFVIVGRKGSGKTAVQYYLSTDLAKRGYITKFFSFYTDIRNSDYTLLAQTQRIDFLATENIHNIFLYYDFREVWQRTFLIKIAEGLVSSDISNSFTSFVLGERSRLASIFDGIKRSLNVSLSANMGSIAASFNFDLSKFSDGELPISKYNEIALILLKETCAELRFYLFVDELVFSKLDAKDDEVRSRAAMVRDIFRVAREMNNFFVKNDLDFHIICSIRPEIRNLINELDAEIGKILDGKDVQLEWSIESEEASLLWDIFKQKIIHSSNPNINFDEFVDKRITFASKETALFEFVKYNTWARPRDLVRLLQSVAKTSPGFDRISERAIKGALNEYSRASMKEIMDELTVNFGSHLYGGLRQAIARKEYATLNDFMDAISGVVGLSGIDSRRFIDELFHYGVIGNIDWTASRHRRYYYFYRREEYLNDKFGVQIHPGLWHYFNIRTR